MSPHPTTSSFVVLGLLGIGPWTAAELASQFQRSTRYIWDRSERSLYSEPKRLVELGWAEPVRTRRGGRPVTEYRITAAGRAALEDWLKTPPVEPNLTIEVLVRVMLADQGDKSDVLAALSSSAAQWRARLEHVVGAMASEYLRDGGPFPQRAAIVASILDFLDRFSTMLIEWTEATTAEIEAWPPVGAPGMTATALRTFERLAATPDADPQASAPTGRAEERTGTAAGG